MPVFLVFTALTKLIYLLIIATECHFCNSRRIL